MNHDLSEKVDDIQQDFEQHKVESWRYEILDFANSCMNKKKHTKEEFDHILKTHDDYASYIKEKGIANGQVTVAYDYIVEIYKKCMAENSFLTGKEDQKEGKKE